MALLLPAIIASFIGTLLALEAKAWAPYLSRWMVRRAAARIPAEIEAEERRRWVEEMQADLASYSDRPLGGLLFAVRLLRKGGKRLAGELALQQKLSHTEGHERAHTRDELTHWEQIELDVLHEYRARAHRWRQVLAHPRYSPEEARTLRAQLELVQRLLTTDLSEDDRRLIQRRALESYLALRRLEEDDDR